jgi:hypothetical protein
MKTSINKDFYIKPELHVRKESSFFLRKGVIRSDKATSFSKAKLSETYRMGRIETMS